MLDHLTCRLVANDLACFGGVLVKNMLDSPLLIVVHGVRVGGRSEQTRLAFDQEIISVHKVFQLLFGQQKAYFAYSTLPLIVPLDVGYLDDDLFLTVFYCDIFGYNAFVSGDFCCSVDDVISLYMWVLLENVQRSCDEKTDEGHREEPSAVV